MKLKCELVISDIADEIVAVPVGENASAYHLVLKLNEESRKIVELLKDDTSIEKIVTEIKKEYQIDDIQLREYITEFIEQLKENDLIDEWIPRHHDNRRIFDAKSKPAKFSGGEQRLLSVLSVIATRPNAELLIIDEPLNNLDFINARNISNLINRVIRDNPRMAVLMISHCRIFPFITREIKLTPRGVEEVPGPYTCHSCFGEHDNEGFYK